MPGPHSKIYEYNIKNVKTPDILTPFTLIISPESSPDYNI